MPSTPTTTTTELYPLTLVYPPSTPSTQTILVYTQISPLELSETIKAAFSVPQVPCVGVFDSERDIVFPLKVVCRVPSYFVSGRSYLAVFGSAAHGKGSEAAVARRPPVVSSVTVTPLAIHRLHTAFYSTSPRTMSSSQYSSVLSSLLPPGVSANDSVRPRLHPSFQVQLFLGTCMHISISTLAHRALRGFASGAVRVTFP